MSALGYKITISTAVACNSGIAIAPLLVCRHVSFAVLAPCKSAEHAAANSDHDLSCIVPPGSAYCSGEAGKLRGLVCNTIKLT